MVAGQELHELVAALALAAKRELYRREPDEAREALETLRAREEESIAACRPEWRERARSLRRFHWSALNHRLEEVLSKQPHIGTDALVALVVPYVVNLRLDGSALGLSPELSCDAFSFGEMVVCDLKFGTRAEFHRLSTTGYALAMEASLEQPVVLGCVVYVTFSDSGRVSIDRDYHLIGDELRQWFLEARDERLMLVHDNIEPDVAGACPQDCPYLRDCWTEGQAHFLIKDFRG